MARSRRRLRGEGFNPRPASSARRTPMTPIPEAASRSFNPRPASSARRTKFAGGRVLIAHVSTHAPLRQRGERALIAHFSHPTSFNPRPASSARRTLGGATTDAGSFVSTHAPLRQRGERRRRTCSGIWSSFNPRPASSARRTLLIGLNPLAVQFQPTPRFVSEANRVPRKS